MLPRRSRYVINPEQAAHRLAVEYEALLRQEAVLGVQLAAMAHALGPEGTLLSGVTAHRQLMARRDRKRMEPEMLAAGVLVRRLEGDVKPR
jgi:hypothetical protein